MKKKFILILGVCLVCMLILFNNIKVCKVSAYAITDNFSNFTSDSYILLDKNSNTVLAEKNSKQKMQVASICKLMTLLIAFEKIDNNIINLNDEVLISEYSASMGGSQAFLDAGCKYKLIDLIKSVIVASANDSAVAISEVISGNEQSFVNLMNEKAKMLNMNNTVYANATGLPAPNQYSTAYDTAIILKEVSKYKLFNKFSNIWMDNLVHPSGRNTELINTNRLIKYYNYCKCGKTGYTDEAGYCLSSIANNGNLELIAVTLKCDKPSDRFKESMDLFNYGFANYENKKVLDKNMPLLNNVKVSLGKKDILKVNAKEDFYIVDKKGDNSNIKIKLDLIKNVKAPITKGNKVGIITVVKNGKVLAEIDIVASENILKQSYFDILNKIVDNWNFKLNK